MTTRRHSRLHALLALLSRMNGTRRPRLRAVLFAAFGLAGQSAGPAPAGVTCSVSAIQFRDAFAGQQLLVSGGDRDVTRQVAYSSTNPAVAAVGPTGYVTSTGDGSGTIRIAHAAGTLDLPVTASAGSARGPVDFRIEVGPLLSKLGCNAGGYHGKASGQNGFKLLLFGFDAEFDHAAITREARSRRVFPAAPDLSLFLLKATGRVPHGGTKLKIDGADYQVLRRWIAASTPMSAPTPRGPPGSACCPATGCCGPATVSSSPSSPSTPTAAPAT